MGTIDENAGREPARKGRSWWRVAAALVGLLVVGEILLRVVFGLGTPVLYQADAECGYLPQADQHIHRFFSHNDINHYSMRSAEIAMPKPAGHVRVLFIGDSVTYGTTSVDQKLIFTSRLAETLPAIEHKPVDVMNASAGGWSIGNEVGYLKSRGTFDADVVLLVLNTGDPSQPLTPFREDLSYPTHRPWTAIGETVSRYIMPRVLRRAAVQDNGTSAPSAASEAETLVKNRALLDQADAYCTQHRAVFGIVYVPFVGWQGDVAARAHAALADWTADNHAIFVDTQPALATEKPDAVSIDGDHLRPYGNEVVAREIARQWGVVDEAMSAASGASTAPAHASK